MAVAEKSRDNHVNSRETCEAHDVHEAYKACQSGTGVLIDVRTPVEFRSSHATGAINRPLEGWTDEVIQSIDSDKAVYLICASGNRSQKAAALLTRSRGLDRMSSLDRIYSVEGGMRAWESAKLTVVRGKKAISLERQVRITAGMLVLLGALMSWFVDPKWVILPGFIGAGLTFAGITDTCGMAMMLAKMPWNQVKVSAEAQ